jgi:hypothetical protein
MNQVMKRYIKHIIPCAVIAMSMGMASCTGDLDVTPINPNLTTTLSPDALFNKCYANIALAGNGGANGDCDIDGLDGGTTGFVRQMFNSNELTTDEAICSWSDDGIQQFDYNSYDASHPMLNGYFARLTTGINYCNQYINEAGELDATKTAEVRFVRAFEYYLLMDAFGNIPFATSLTTPVRMTRQEAYDWIEKELLDLEPSLSEAKAKKSSDPGYGRVDKAACWLLLSRLYLNAEVYTGKAEWQKAADYAKKVMGSDYRLNTQGVNGWSAYQMLFMGDNGETNAAYEAVFPILQDGLKTTSWGTSQYLSAGSFDADMHANPKDPSATNGVSGQTWGGNRVRPDLVEKFFPNGGIPNLPCTQMPEAAGDDRAIFDGEGRTLDNGKGATGTFKDGFACAKFVNFKTDGSAGHDATFVDTDFFMFRVAEAYLTFAEATARLNGGKATAEGLAAINTLRTRARTTEKAGMSLRDICDEWSREFYFEGIRRPTLIRFGYFGGDNNYNWSYKGGVKQGRSFSADKNVFAIPQDQVKGIFVQNPGY